MIKYTLLMLLCISSFSKRSFGQLRLESIGYWETLDSAEIEQFSQVSDEFRSLYQYGGYKKTNEILPYGSFIGMRINYVPPPSNFSALYISKDGNIIPTTKKLVDSLFMRAFLESSFSINNDEICFFYMLLTRSGYLVKESSDLLSFQTSIKDRFDNYRKEQMNRPTDSSRIQTTSKYSYNRAFRTIYEYRFYADGNGNWVLPPEKIALFKEVGPYNYWR